MKKITLKPGVVTDIPTGRIIPDENQPRGTFREKPLEDLAANIKARGILQPITVVPSGDKFMIKMGERRWRAAKLAGVKACPCILDSAGGEYGDLLIDQLSENDLREGLNPIERGQALQTLKDQGMGPKEISEHLASHGITYSRPAVSNTLRLLALPASALQMVKDGSLKESYARLLLPYLDWPDVIDEVCKDIDGEKPEYIDKEYVEGSIVYQLGRLGTSLTSADSCSKKECQCYASIKEWGREQGFCMDPEKAEARRKAAEKNSTPAGAPAATKKPETDPTKVKPKKLSPNKDGVVPTARRSFDTYKSLAFVDFDTSDCETCPHRALASNSGSPDLANPTCFYVPCFENLERQQRKIENREDSIRELIDDQLLPVLIETATSEPVAKVVLLPLLVYVATQYPVEETPAAEHGGWVHSASPSSYGESRSTADGLRHAPGAMGRGTLTQLLAADLSIADEATLIEASVRSLNLEQRRELALDLSIDISSFWSNNEAYAKLFTKPQIVELIGDKFEGADVPAGEWRQRLADDAGVPDLVREVWLGPIKNVYRDKADDVDEDEDLAA